MILSLFFLVLGVTAAAISFVFASKPRRFANAMLTEPHCAKCDYDLRGYTGQAPVRCPECGADLTARHAIVWGQFGRKRPPVWVVLTSVAVPLLVFLTVTMLFRQTAVPVAVPMFPGSPAFVARSNAAVIASLATSANSPWDWQELERRMAAGTLSSAEVGQAVDSLIAFLKTQPTGQPLSWSEQFVAKADGAGKISNEQYVRLSQAFYKTPSVSIAGKIRGGGTLPVVIQANGPWQLPGSQLVLALRQVSISSSDAPADPGTVLSAISNYDRSNQADPDHLSEISNQGGISARATVGVAPGNYMLKFTLDSAVLLDKTAPQLDYNLPGQASRWPRGRAAWTDVIAVPLTVLPADQSPISMTADPALNPQSSISITSIRVIRKGTGQKVTIAWQISRPGVACSFDVFLRIEDQQHAIGQMVVGAQSTMGGEQVCQLKSLDPAIGTADVLLRPSPVRAEGTPGIDRVWGEPIDINGVVLKRYDLPSGAAVTQP